MKVYIEITAMYTVTGDDVASILEQAIPKSHIMVYAVGLADAEKGSRRVIEHHKKNI